MVLLLTQATGCVATLSNTEEAVWGTLLHRQVVAEPLPFKSTGVAGFWSAVIPGTGHFYLGQPGLGTMHFIGNLLWPINIVWTLPAGLQAAGVENKKRTVEYYQFGSHGERIDRLRTKGKLPSTFSTHEQVEPTLQLP